MLVFYAFLLVMWSTLFSRAAGPGGAHSKGDLLEVCLFALPHSEDFSLAPFPVALSVPTFQSSALRPQPPLFPCLIPPFYRLLSFRANPSSLPDWNAVVCEIQCSPSRTTLLHQVQSCFPVFFLSRLPVFFFSLKLPNDAPWISIGSGEDAELPLIMRPPPSTVPPLSFIPNGVLCLKRVPWAL